MRDDKRLNILLIYGHLRTGGIETLIVRMANWFVSQGYKVNLLLQETGELIELLDNRIEIEILGWKRFYIYFPIIGTKILEKYDKKGIDIIYSFGPEGCYLAAFVYKYAFKKNAPIFINGIYHPNEFALSGGVNILDRMYIEMYNIYIDNDSKLFMSEQVKNSNENILKTKIPEAKIWPLPIDPKYFNNIEKRKIPYRIVSIGRFANFKTYNLYMFDIIEELRDQGYPATWDVYGYGPLESEMSKLLKARKLEGCIFMKGKLPYREYSAALSVAHVFVGVGSSLIEAGFCKVPCIPAIQDDKEGLTYGFIYDLPYYSCGEELDSNYKKIKVVEAIRNIFDMNESEYDKEVNLTYNYVQAYSMDRLMKDFIKLANALKIKQKIEKYPSYKFFIYAVKYFFFNIRSIIALRTRIKKVLEKWIGVYSNISND